MTIKFFSYLNFASFGFLIGHEITHGFDERGKQFDENGNLHDWWDTETDQKFQSKIQCMIAQYDNYTLKGINMNVSGSLSKGENLADNGGLKLALKVGKTQNIILSSIISSNS